MEMVFRDNPNHRCCSVSCDLIVRKVGELSTENSELKDSLSCLQSKLTDVETSSQFLEDECVSFRAVLVFLCETLAHVFCAMLPSLSALVT